MAFSDKQVQNLKPRQAPYRVWERGSDPGFGLQISPGGVKAFFLFYRHDGCRRFYKLGRYGQVGIAEARERARKARRLLEQGIDPKAYEAQAKEAEARARREASLRGSVRQLFDAYIAQLEANGSLDTARKVRNIYRCDIKPVLGETMKAYEVEPHHVKAVLHNIIKRGSKIQANRVRSYMSAAFSFGIEHDNDPANLKTDVLFHLERNPVRDVPKPTKMEKPGERDLSTSEIHHLWHGLAHSGIYAPMQIAIKLCLATGGQRIIEIIEASWAEFDTERMLWELPSSRTKNRKPHVVPLIPLAVELLEDLRAYSGDSRLLFPKRNNESEPMELWTVSKAITHFCQTIDREGNKIEGQNQAGTFNKFTPRDLRRTCKSRMGELGIDKLIRDRLHNHALQDVSSRHYDRYDYLAEKREAMERWSAYMQSVIAGAKVVPLRKPDTA